MICGEKDCLEPARLMTFNGLCDYHEVVRSARNLRTEAFDRLRETLATTPPISDDERARRRVRWALTMVEHAAGDLRRKKRQARKDGATESQIADAMTRGKAGA